jgi:hypothetical protein
MNRVRRFVVIGVLACIALGVLATGAVFARHRIALGTVRERAERNRAEIATIQGADCAREPLGSSAVAGNAWDFYARAFDRHAAIAGAAAPGSLPFGADLEALFAGDSFDAERADALLAQFAEPIELVRSGLNRSHACSPLDRNLGFDAPLPSIQAARSVGQLMLLDSRRSESRGDLAAATAKSLEAMAYAQDLGRHGSLICAVVAGSLERSALGRLERLVGSGGLDDRTLYALGAQLASLDASRPPFASAIRDERLALVAGLALMCERGVGTQTLGADVTQAPHPGAVERFRAWLSTPVAATAIEVADEQYRALEEVADGPFATFQVRSRQMYDAIGAGENSVLSVVVPALDGAAGRDAGVRAKLRLVLLAVRLERHRRTTGALPATLAEVASGPAASLAVDPFNGEPVGYRSESGGAVLWSVGPNLENDNATPGEEDETRGGDVVVRLPAPPADGDSRRPVS